MSYSSLFIHPNLQGIIVSILELGDDAFETAQGVKTIRLVSQSDKVSCKYKSDIDPHWEKHSM